MRLQILDSARDDLIEGFYFYEKQEPGLGAYFLTSLYSDMEALKILFGIHPKAYRGFHRALSNRFPFAIYYTYDHGGRYDSCRGGLPPQAVLDSAAH
jgi:hypothetical protein